MRGGRKGKEGEGRGGKEREGGEREMEGERTVVDARGGNGTGGKG